MDIADAELIWPGSFIAHDDNDASHEALMLLHLLDAAFAEALLALVCFVDALKLDRGDDVSSRWERDMVERREAEEEAWQGRPDPTCIADWQAMAEAMALKRIDGSVS